ncbi:hypothetical protein Ndes2437A_g04603 [Nannochloris sp. 'desiccata']|nr:hypothetical protein KSW81_004392 [Chlorella desiccata (nom. nud.)]
MTESETPKLGNKVTPFETGLLGAAVLAAGAFASGAAHYTSTAKKLTEEGIPASARLRALPLAARALGVSTVLCAAMGGAALAAWHFAGLESRPVADVATFRDAVALAKQQRDIVRRELRSSLFVEEKEEVEEKQ